MDAQPVGAETCQKGAYGKPRIAAYREDSHGPAFPASGNPIHHKGRFRMKKGTAYAAAEG